MPTVPKDFSKLTIEQATSLVKLPANQEGILKTNRAFVEGDHWQSADGWIGPWPIAPEGAKSNVQQFVTWMQMMIRRGFLSVNAIGECIEREVTGTVGIEPRWSFAPTEIELPANATPDSPAAADAQQRAAAKAQRAEDLATGWWDKRGAHAMVQRMAESLLYGAGPIAESCGRFFIPATALEDEVDSAGNLTGRKQLRVASIEDAIDKIHFEILDADQGRVVHHPVTLAEIGIKPTKIDEQTAVELTYLEQNAGADGTRRTVIATNVGDKVFSTTLDLGGRLTMMTVRRKAFLTEQTRVAQRALNFAASMVRRNIETGGFQEEIVLNAHIPGHFEGEGENRRYVPDPIERGPTAMTAFRGIEQSDAQGNKSYTTPTVLFRDPVDPEPTIKAKTEFYADVLAACHQKHVLISGDAMASGESRIQARADHVAELRRTQAPVEQFGRWMLETLIALADALANNGKPSGVLNGLRATFSCYLDAGPVDASERKQNVDEMESGTLSRATAMERNGVVDVDAELARIDAEPSADLDAEQKRAAIYGAWINAGVGEAAAGKRAGLSDAELEDLTTAPTDIPPPEPAANTGNTGNTGAGQ